MTALSINLPDSLAQASQEAASKMGISRTEFIRRAVMHEIKLFEEKCEEEAMVASMLAMKESHQYLKEANEIMNGFSADIGKEKNEWWHKKKS